MFRKLTIACALSLASLHASISAELPKDGLVEAGALTYGVAATFPPFEFQKDGALAGFDIDMIEAIGKKLSATPKPMNMDFQGLIPALLGGRLDLINSAMYINDKRKEQVDFVPYMTIGELIIVKAGNASGITGRDDSLCGKTISVTLGAIEETYARADAERCKAAGKAEVTVQTLPTGPDTVTAVVQGRADAMFTSTPGAAVMLDEMAGKIEVAGAEFDSTTSIGMAVRKGETALQDALKSAVAELIADGTYAKLVEKWKLPASVVPSK
jgi:polar amino acid transport system substrate-binding protein